MGNLYVAARTSGFRDTGWVHHLDFTILVVKGGSFVDLLRDGIVSIVQVFDPKLRKRSRFLVFVDAFQILLTLSEQQHQFRFISQT